MKPHSNPLAVTLCLGAAALPALSGPGDPVPGCHSPVAYPTYPDSVPGDCDLDGDVDQDDLDIWGAFALNPPGPYDPVSPRQGDVNWDRQVDINDLNIILAHAGTAIAPIPPMYGVNIDTTVSGLSISMLDNDTGQLVKTSLPLYSTAPQWLPPASEGGPGSDLDSDGKLDPVPLSDVQLVDFVEFTDGFDVTVRITNNHTDIRAAGQIRLDGVTFGTSPIPHTVTAQDMRQGGAARTVTYDPSIKVYPGIYVPAQVIEANGYTIGMSVACPVLEYKHYLTFMATRAPSQGTPWAMSCHLNMYNTNNNRPPSEYQPAGNFQPGESRDYIVSVRVQEPYECDHDNEWLRTLRPYRRYFRALYGPTRYTPDRQPVNALAVAQTDHITGTNPYGFLNPSTHRIDTLGWGPWLTDFNATAVIGWGRLMVWAPTGLYPTYLGNNFPPQFTSQWAAMPGVTAPPLLAGYDNGADKNLGLWWGRAAQVADTWDDPTLDVLDRTNAAHVAFAFNEMDGADDVNARTVGLDTLSRMGQWSGYFWLQDMQDQYPGVRFVTEPVHADFINGLVPNWAVMTKDPVTQGGDLYHFDQGTIIQDFLNPGHETWGKVEVGYIKTYFGYNQGQTPTNAEIAQILDEVAALNLVPCYFGPKPSRTPLDFVAADTEKINVPADLR